MPVEPPTPVRGLEASATLLACDECDVRWRDEPTAPCWYCGKPGREARPERLVLD